MMIHVLTDCNSDSLKDVNEVCDISKKDLRQHIRDLSESSVLSVSITGQQLTATNEGRLLSLSIVNSNMSWYNILGDDLNDMFL